MLIFGCKGTKGKQPKPKEYKHKITTTLATSLKKTRWYAFGLTYKIMNWINVNDKHFVDIERFEDGSYRWTENNNCPNEPFLVGLFVGNNKTGFIKLEYWLVVLSDNGLEEWTEDGTYPLDCWEITDIEFWCPIVPPKTE